MSIEALRWALDEGSTRDLEPAQRHILLVLGNRADEKGYCYPSISWICHRTGMARRTVQQHMKEMEVAGVLHRDTRPDGRGGRTSDAIWLGLKQFGLPLPDPRADFALGGATAALGGAQYTHHPRAESAPKNQEVDSRKAGRGTRLPPDWKPTPDLEAWARSTRPDLNHDDVLARFKDHWASTPGQRGTKLDWAATYRNWVRGERGSGTRAAPAASRPTITCSDCKKPATAWTGNRCNPCWRKYMGIEVSA